MPILCFHSGCLPSSDGALLTRSLPCPRCLSAPPQPPWFWFHLFLCSQTTSGQLCWFLFNVSFLDISHSCCYQRQTFILMPPPFCPHSPPQGVPQGEGGLGCSRLGYLLPQSQGRWGPAPRMLQQSEEGVRVDHEGCRGHHLPLFCWGGVGHYLSQPGAPPLVSYLQLLE